MDEPSQENVGLLSSDEGGNSSDLSSEDEVTEHVPRSAPPTNMAAARAQVPTISVTPHSPGVLDDSLQQLRRLHAAVQHMRAAPLPLLQATGSSRLSTSCPSLCKDGAAEQDCASPTHTDYYPQSRKGSGESMGRGGGGGGQWGLWERREEGRRSSWAALEPGAGAALARGHDQRGHRSALNGHSASLSSMESEGEAPRPVRHSTHSLNDNDLAKDFEVVAAAHRAGVGVGVGAGVGAGAGAGAGGAGGEAARLGLGSRLPLQKSVSTPSIVAAVQPPLPQPTQNILSAGGASETESEEEASAATAPAAQPGRRNNALQDHLGLHRLAFLEQATYDHHAEKRRKRGSLFFRKKKDKCRKASHAWQPAAGKGECHWCGRDLPDKPLLRCDHCNVTVHENVCKDYIIECNKAKASKTSVAKSLSASSGKSSKRSSVSGQSQNSTSTSNVYNDEKDGSDHKHDQSNASDDAGVSEWPEAYITADQLGDEAVALGLGVPEPDTWAAGAPKGLAKQLGEKETKRQEHIYELILTEKHHCLTIRLMQKMFAEGMVRFAGVSASHVARMFPCVPQLWALHAALLARLRARQRAAPAVPSVADILADTFAPPPRDKLKAAYGEFCSRHRDAVDVFKECCAREPRLARFIRKCQQNPLLRKKGVPECVLFVAQRLTKYPLLLEPLLKTAGDERERDMLQRALCGVKEILVDVDNQVAAKEREDRKLEIYHRIDAKSFANFRGRKFKKSDILQANRILKFEGVATLMQGRSKMQTLLVIVLTDVLFFLHDNNNKYTFFTPDNKTGVVSLVKLLVREKAGAEGRGLYLICSGPSEPEMFELRVHRPKDIQHWIQAIRVAVQSCPEEVEESEAAAQTISSEERQRQLEARHEEIRLITEMLRARDREHASLLEEKMALLLKLRGLAGTHGALEVPHTGVSTVFPGGLVFPDYVRLAAPSADTHALWQEVCRVVKEALEACSAGWSAGAALGRSTSSAGERHSAAYESPALPRRADTFAGFDANRHKGVAPRLSTDTPGEGAEAGAGVVGAGAGEEPRLEQLGSDAALKLQHAIYTLTCIVWQQLTTIHSLEAQVVAWRGGAGASGAAPGGRAHEAQLEELRHAQARLTAERAAWEAQRGADLAAIQDGQCGGRGAGGRAHEAQLEELRHAQARLTAERAAWEAQRGADLAAIQDGQCGGRGAGGRAHEAQLEELRHAQARLTAERAAWEAQRGADLAAIQDGQCGGAGGRAHEAQLEELRHAQARLTAERAAWEAQRGADLAAIQDGQCGGAGGRAHEAQLEELRHAQARLTAERAAWEAQRGADLAAIQDGQCGGAGGRAHEAQLEELRHAQARLTAERAAWEAQRGADLAAIQDGQCGGRGAGGRAHEAQLEELRHAQARLTAERAAWEAQRGADLAAIQDGQCGGAGGRAHEAQLEELRHAQARLTAERAAWEAQRGADLAAIQDGQCGGRGAGGRAHEAQLEELRHAQARLTAERAAWEAQRGADLAAIQNEKRQLEAASKKLAEQREDVEQQRERLYRRLERLQQHGGSQEEIASVGTLSPDSSVSDTSRRKEPKWRTNRGSTGSESSLCVAAPLPPPQLLSAQNESRAAARAPAPAQIVKQQLPLKLASGKNQQTPPGYHRLHESPSEHGHAPGVLVQHTRTGSSPAPLPSQQQQQQLNNRATRTNTYPKLPDKFRVRSPEPAPPAPPSPAPAAPPEEEVIYF